MKIVANGGGRDFVAVLFEAGVNVKPLEEEVHDCEVEQERRETDQR